MSAPAVESALPQAPAALSQQLKTHTASAHTAAEDSRFVAELMGGTLDVAALVSLLDQSIVIYRALETALAAHTEHPQLGAFIDRKLARVAALEADMAYHHGADWEAQLADGRIVIVPATLAYADMLTTMGRESIEFLLAHHYVRYMGDLSGGLIISRMVERHYGVASEGLNFYDFDAIAKPKPYKDRYRELLDTTDFSRAQQDAILNFAAESFELNLAVFVDLDAARKAARAS
ncbi:biliverdin-producing heme oxygenase [Arthrobacter sp. H35-D1]|uniref:biliverdin-producing heme oxygenase n=1 Tax=Arthrobacter sp. H35-D1 TaxID=3046202 RepID=UPI0024B8897C|nr:biliverdin-producing heme oxygenase [Arthrobacter sp. H35-D1]MDJ0311973.1 biliverdin-producing heme oxygenase [Arthrobacter sp. H35-D1]